MQQAHHQSGGARRAPDLALVLALALAAFLAYAWLALPLARTVFFDYLNLAFDFDPVYFVKDLATSTTAHGGVNYKHPLWMLFRPFALPFTLLDYPPKQAAALAMALTGALSVGLAFVYARLAGLERPASVAAALLFGASSASLFTAVVPESYGWVNLSLAALWCVYLGCRRGDWQGRSALLARLAAATLVAGATITNLAQALLAEFWLRWRRGGMRSALLRTALFAVAVLALLGLVILVYQPLDLWQVLTHPVKTAKDVYWLRTKGGTVGLGQLLQTYLAYAFYAPEFERVALSSEVVMLDFRGWLYAGPALLVVIVWLLFWLANVLWALRTPRGRWLATALLATVLFNLLFHLDYQFRGSVYIYATHLHFPLFALSLSAAPWLREQGRGLRLAHAALLLLLAAAAMAINGQRALELQTHMQTLVLPAHSPEIGRGGSGPGR